MAKIFLVTGSSGYIGGETMIKLKDQGHTVIAVDIKTPPRHLKHLPDRFYQEDFSNARALELLETFSPTAVIHCAGSSLVGPSLAQPAIYFQNNFVKTKILLDFINSRRIDTRVIFSSSAATYGEPVITPCNEVDPTDPISPYGQSKAMIEWMLEGYKNAYGIDYVAFRYFNACGADSQGRHGQAENATHIIARVLESLRDQKTFCLNGDDYDTEDGTCVRDYVHVEDIADAHVLAGDRSIPSGVYNLGTAQGYSNRQIMNNAENITGKKLDFIVGERRCGDPAMLTASAHKFHMVSGWQPKFQLGDIIQHAWSWYTRPQDA